ncbi:MAG: amidohydrolase family protein [Candidatus Jordarchaeales archaeon]
MVCIPFDGVSIPTKGYLLEVPSMPDIFDFHAHVYDRDFWFRGKGVLRAYAKDYFKSPVRLAVSLPLLARFESWMKPRELRPSSSSRLILFDLVGSFSSISPLGLKLHPPLQDVSACDPGLDETYGLAEREGCPVVVHFGYCSAGNLRFADPLSIIEVVDKFPGLTVVMAHMGTGRGNYWENAKRVARCCDGVYFETSWAPPGVVREAVELFGAERVVFGSDYPFRSVEEELDKVLSLGFSDEELYRILWRNADELLRGVIKRSSSLMVREK